MLGITWGKAPSSKEVRGGETVDKLSTILGKSVDMWISQGKRGGHKKTSRDLARSTAGFSLRFNGHLKSVPGIVWSVLLSDC